MSVFNKLLNKNKKEPTAQQTPPASGGNTSAPNPKPETQAQPAKAQAPTGSASLEKAQKFLADVKSRRTIYAIGKDQVLPDKDLIELIQEAVRESPSSFNSQSSRVVILLGDEHDKYWEETVLGALKKVTDEEGFNHAKGRVDGFKAGYGTVLFYEDEETIKGMQEKFAAYADNFPHWSGHASGMAQIHTWTALELASYGASLQHYGNLTSGDLATKYSIPSSWKLHAELVFGSVKAPAGDKTYMSNDDRFKVFGSK